MGTLCLLFVSKQLHVSVSLLFINKRSVSWSLVCQTCSSHHDIEQFHHYTLGPHESMDRMYLATRLGNMLSSQLHSHLRTLHIENNLNAEITEDEIS